MLKTWRNFARLSREAGCRWQGAKGRGADRKAAGLTKSRLSRVSP